MAVSWLSTAQLTAPTSHDGIVRCWEEPSCARVCLNMCQVGVGTFSIASKANVGLDLLRSGPRSRPTSRQFFSSLDVFSAASTIADADVDALSLIFGACLLETKQVRTERGGARRVPMSPGTHVLESPPPHKRRRLAPTSCEPALTENLLLVCDSTSKQDETDSTGSGIHLVSRAPPHKKPRLALKPATSGEPTNASGVCENANFASHVRYLCQGGSRQSHGLPQQPWKRRRKVHLEVAKTSFKLACVALLRSHVKKRCSMLL